MTINKQSNHSRLILFLVLFLFFYSQSYAQYKESPHRALNPGEVAVTKPGSYDVAGTTYVLTNDISCTRSAIFLGEDVTLDLNGYTITYADTTYEHLPNYSFEEGTVGWDFSKAPSAKVKGTLTQVFIGDSVLSLSAGEEIVSEYINIPLSNRSYMAMCGVAKLGMSVSIYVEDENGASVICNTQYKSGTTRSCPVENASPKLGGGFICAHLTGLEAGKYRVRVKANTNCIVDHIDLRPTMDVGIGIVNKTWPYGSNYHLLGFYSTAFYDYTDNYSAGTPIDGIPVADGSGTVTIKNGIIKSGAVGIISWGIKSTAKNVSLILDNLKISAAGINTNAVNAYKATVTNCYFDIDNKFVIDRHHTAAGYAVVFEEGASGATEVSNCDFYGGQGCLSITSMDAVVHDNFFENHQTVTNHYSLSVKNSGHIYNNVIAPLTGSGIGLFRVQNVEVYNNEIRIKSSPPTCEYGKEDYSCNGIRMADYGSDWGSSRGCFNNHIHNNKFYIESIEYADYPEYIPVATGIFYSASGGHNYIYDNEFILNASHSKASKSLTAPIYIGGGAVGGKFTNNKFLSNMASFWIASPYGNAETTEISGNTIIKSDNSGEDYSPIRLGYGNNVATDIEFRSNNIVNSDFDFDKTNRNHTYSVYWTLTINVPDNLNGTEVLITNKSGEEVFKGVASDEGKIVEEFEEYTMTVRGVKEYKSPYTIVAGDIHKTAELNRNKEITMSDDIVDSIDITEENGDALNFTCMPNPFRNELKISFGKESKDRKVSVLGIDNRMYKNILSEDKELILNLSFLSAGTYFIRVQEEGKVSTSKLIKL